jgi:ribosomal protein S18 acetylase RimI-like enzyme
VTRLIRPARADEHAAVARLWFDSWVSTGLAGDPADATLEDLVARVPQEVEAGWRLHVAEDNGALSAMLAYVPETAYLDQLFVAPHAQGKGVGRALLAFARAEMPEEMWLRTDARNARAIAWYEREGFIREKTEKHPKLDRMMAYFRWRAAR